MSMITQRRRAPHEGRPPIRKPSKDLTRRERQVVNLYVRGYLYKEIGKELGISGDTAKNVISRAAARLDLYGNIRVLLMEHAVRLGLLDDLVRLRSETLREDLVHVLDTYGFHRELV